jgi:hypothetical protein
VFALKIKGRITLDLKFYLNKNNVMFDIKSVLPQLKADI